MKRLIALILAAIMAFAGLTVIITVAQNDVVKNAKGDINGDGEISSMDYVLLKRAYFGTYKLNDLQTDSADINGDGEISSMDYILLKRAYFGTFEIKEPAEDPSIPSEDPSESSIPSDEPSESSVPSEDPSESPIPSEDPSESSIPSEDTSDDSSDPSDEPSEDEKVNLNVAGGKKYTASPEASPTYPDVYNSELTNGVYPDIYGYSNSALSGYGTRNLTVDIDLGKEYSGIHTFKADYYLDTSAGISSSLTFKVSVSSNGTSWTNVGTLTQTAESRMGTLNSAELRLEESVSARYVRFNVIGTAAWIFLEELSAIALTEPESKLDYSAAVEDTYDRLGTIIPFTGGDDVNTTLPKICISEGMTYTVDRPANGRYADTGAMLTDGIYGTLYENGCWVGFDGGKDFTIRLDLGATVNDIASIEVMCFAKEYLDIYMPAAMDFKTVDENGNVKEIGRLYGIPKSTDGRKNFVFSTGKKYSARYIEITVHTVEDALHLLGEIFVYSYRSDLREGELYPEVVIESGKTYWENPSDTYKNLISGKTCQISLNGAVSKTQYANNTDISSPLLTDGEYSAHYNIHNGKFFKFCQGDKRSVVFDLDRISSVEKFTISFCHIENWGVYAPANVRMVVSDDGINWYRIGSIEIKTTSIDGIRRGEWTLDKGIKARYVVFCVDTVSWTGIDEIQVFGRQNTENAESPDKYESVHEESAVDKRKEPSEDLLGGTKHLCLLYHSEGSKPYTVENLIPYLAYVDRQGVIQDTMFDSYLFLHDTGEMPSGASAFEGSVMSDWQWCIDDMFVENTNLYALDAAAGQVKEALGLGSDFKYKVTATLYYPNSTMTDFGDVDGDGKSESFAVYEDRMKAYKWYIGQIEKRFAEAGFENIVLVGYYWWDESINNQEPYIKQTTNAISDYLHSIDRDFFWIPYHCASGFGDWANYGFDIACMQPNYVFKAEAPYANLINNEKLTRMYGMGVEIEICGSSLGDKQFFKKYMEYLTLGAESGYMTDTVNMYYQERFAFNKAAYSTTEMARTVYEATYHYIKGDLKNVPDALEDMNLDGEKNKIFKGQIPFESEKLREFKVSTLPEHGTVIFDDDGSFYYFPEKDYEGEVRFSFVYNEYLSWSEECEIVINLK